MIKNKIILGSANVNVDYGLKKNKLKINEFNSLLNFAFKKGIKTIDTSPQYGDSEKIIGLSKKNFNVITKIPKIPKKIKIKQIEKWIINIIKKSKKNLKGKKIYGILLQNAEILLGSKAKIINETLLKLKDCGNFEKIGVSIYNFKTLNLIIDKLNIDFVQLPYNVLDQRFKEKKLINKLKQKNIEIHARSIFLQGLLIEKNINLPKKMIGLEKAIFKWNTWISKKNINPVNACLAFVLQNKNINKIVIGFNSKNNFEDVINYKKKKINFNKFNVKIAQNLLDPRKWS